MRRRLRRPARRRRRWRVRSRGGTTRPWRAALSGGVGITAGLRSWRHGGG
jgi:hypothetical protein